MEVEGQEITFYSALCPLTLKKRRSWGKKLSRQGIPYRWGYSFHLVVTFKNKIINLWTLQEVKELEQTLDEELGVAENSGQDIKLN